MSSRKASRWEEVRPATSMTLAPEHQRANRRLLSSYHSTVLSLRFLALQEARNSSLRSCKVGAVKANGRRAGRAILLLLRWDRKQEEERLVQPPRKKAIVATAGRDSGAIGPNGNA
jgi:hypothetical protein